MSFPGPKALAERAVCLLLLPAVGFAIYSSVRLAVADSYFRLNTPESLAQAVRVEPGSAEYHQLLAEHLESIGTDPAPEREAAARLSPRESRYWIDLGVMAESRSDYSSAERYYLKAASIDRMFAPRWNLVNFYFRRHDEASFWHWTREALPMAYGDLSSLFRLCWLMTDDAESIRRMIPPAGPVAAGYLYFLMDNDHWASAPAVAKSIAVRATPDDLVQLLDYCGRALTRNPASAVEIWNELSRRGLQSFTRLDPLHGAIVTNGDFHTAPSERGFDWHLAHLDGVSPTLGQRGLSVELTGEQPVEVTVLNEWIPVVPGQRYTLDYQYTSETDGSSGGLSGQASGLAWQISNPVTGALIARSPDLDASQSSAQPATGHLDFTADRLATAMLSLRYERAPGTVRHEEKFTILKVSAHLQ